MRVGWLDGNINDALDLTTMNCNLDKSHVRWRPLQRTLLMTAFCTAGITAHVHSQVAKPVWVSQYNGACSYWEEVTDFAIGDGYVYVTGFEYFDCYNRAFATVKYDYAGRQQWVRNYALGGTNGSAQANAVAVDDAGNVFVTGWSYDYVPGPPEEIIADAATLKYDSDGNLLWEHRYRLPGHNNQPQDITIDSAGNAYVTGAAWIGDANGGFDLFLLKYAPDGTLLWDRTIGKAGSNWDAGYSVALDPNENPIVAGYTQPFFCTFFCITYGYLVKYSSSGQLQWEREHVAYNTANSWWHVAINDAGQIYTFGEIAPPGDLSYLWTSQYDSNGTLIWDRYYDGTANESNFQGGMALTPSGGVVVCGTSWDFAMPQGGYTQIVTLRYEPDGREVWRRLDRGGYAHALGRDVAVDSLGRAFVTGYGFNKNNEEDMVTLRYTPQGELAGTQIYADPNGGSDRANSIAVDEAFNVFVVGDAWVGFKNYYDFTTIRYGGAHSVADINHDGVVNAADLLAVINAWGSCPAPPTTCPADIAPLPDGDGTVNVLDLLMVINNWG